MTVGRNSLYNIAGSVTPLVLALVTIPFYIDVVGTQRYGALAIAWLILGYFGLFDLGLGRATAQRIAALHDSSNDHRARVFWTAIVVNVAMGLVGAALLYLGARYFFQHHFEADPWLIDEMLDALPILAIGVPVATLTGVTSGALQGREKFLDVNIATVIGASLFQLIPLSVAYAIGPTLKGLVAAAVIARVLGFLVFFVRARAHLLVGTSARIDRREWLTLLKFGGWVTIVSIIGPMLVVVDRFFIGALISAVAVTVYTVPFEIVQRISILPRSIAMALFPKLAAAAEGKGKRIAERATLVVNILVTPIIVLAIFASKPFFNLWIGGTIAQQAGPIAIVLLAGYWANAFGIIPYSRLQAAGRPHVVTLVLLAQLPFYVAAIYWAIVTYGVVGAAVVFSIRTTADYILLHRFSTGRWALPPRIAISGTAIIAALVVCLLYPPFSWVWWIGGASTGLFLIATFRKEVPQELQTQLERIIPASLGRHLHYD